MSLLALAAALAAGGCTQRALVGRTDASSAGGDASTGVLFDASVLNNAPVDGPGYVDGRLHAHAVLDYVENVYWFGGDNDPSRIQLWIYQDGDTCQGLSTPGWIPRVRPTDLMGITIGGTGPGRYPVVPETPPRPGNAYILHIINQKDPIIESEGQAGTVVITSVKPGESVTGAWEAVFSTGTLQSQFNAVWCPTGVAP
jgi:hypothetical protein